LVVGKANQVEPYKISIFYDKLDRYAD